MMAEPAARGAAGGDEHRAVVHVGLLEDRRVDENDVGHGAEGRETGTELSCNARARLAQAEEPVERALRRSRAGYAALPARRLGLFPRNPALQPSVD